VTAIVPRTPPQSQVDAGRLLAEHVLAAGADGVPDGTRRSALQQTVDTIGAALAAVEAPSIPAVRELVSGWGGRPVTPVYRSGLRLPAPTAVLVNSAMARALELDDVHEQALVHATATVVPVSLAVADLVGGVSGRRFLDVVAAANDVACRLALAVDMSLGGEHHRPRVMSLTYQTGVLAGALAAAGIADLSVDDAVQCLGIAYSGVAGNLQGLFEGTLSVRLQQGIAAQTAVQAFEFARAGVTGTTESLEGRAGWYQAFFQGRYDRTRLLADLGRSYETDRISLKPYACCKYGHNYIAAAAAMAADHDLDPDRIASIQVVVGRDTWDIICDPLSEKGDPVAVAQTPDPALAQFSLPFMVSTALLRRRLTMAELDPSWRSDAGLAAAMRKTEIVLQDAASGKFEIPEPGRVAVVLDDGTRLDHEERRTLGHPDHPMDTETVAEKFRAAVPRWPAAQVDDLLTLLWRLPELADVRELTEQLGLAR
jgi:2-methylcitrate dehydratase PrpD